MEVAINSGDLSLSVVFISVPGQRDCKSLIASVSAILPVVVQRLDASLPSGALNLSNSKGFAISGIESAISESHHRAREISFKLGCDWALILEDDAVATLELQNLPELLHVLGSCFDLETPIGIHLAPEQFGIMIRKKSEVFLRNIRLADCAVAYILNRPALQSCLDAGAPIMEVADWPKALRRFQWISPLKPMFAHPHISNVEVTSSSFAPRLFRSQSKSLVRKLIEYPYHIMFTFKVASWLGSNYGNGYVQSEKIRSKVIGFHSTKIK